MSQEPNAISTVLSASVHDVRDLAAMLRGLSFSSAATMSIQPAGIEVMVEESRCLIGTAYISAEMFDEFQFTPEAPSESQNNEVNESQGDDLVMPSVFEIHLPSLTESLNIFGTAGGLSSAQMAKKRWSADAGSDDEPSSTTTRRSNAKIVDLNAQGRLDQFFQPQNGEVKKTSLRLSYGGSGHPLTLLLAEDATGPTTTCELATLQPEIPSKFPYNEEEILVWIIMPSIGLRDAISEFDPSCDTLTIIVDPNATQTPSLPALRLQASGMFGSTEIEYPNHKNVLETFQCQERVEFRYRLNIINKTLRALQSSFKTSLQIFPDGLLRLQFMLNTSRSKKDGAFIEFRCLALDDEA
ncbi:Rad1-domain-containing protein [Sistotremastrum suecicum HHB10207 ss-3]|uniref:Rad1-domain-containing protein n=1 Tax=Sistotremastrum suecicum HHB10207 ss-3 TaxID=1314776 RepID=A0A166J078_9AGAM|nr:Rad1-domain-containing protein [Sistotremastrum suecicum HHB10207 ss-3]